MLAAFCYFCKLLAMVCLSTACLKIFSSTRACIEAAKMAGNASLSNRQDSSGSFALLCFMTLQFERFMEEDSCVWGL